MKRIDSFELDLDLVDNLFFFFSFLFFKNFEFANSDKEGDSFDCKDETRRSLDVDPFSTAESALFDKL